MLSTERQAFEAELAILFGGFPAFLTEPRIEAYWRGLARMSLEMFKRCVEHALSEGGEEKVPTVQRVWELSRKVTAEARSRMRGSDVPAIPARPFDPFIGHANRVMFMFFISPAAAGGHVMRGAPSAESLAAMIRAKNKLVDDYRSICEDEPQASLELRDKLLAKFEELFVPMTPAELTRHQDHFQRTKRTADQPQAQEISA